MTHPIGFDNGGYRRFGWIKRISKFHLGSDINCPMDTPVMAMAPGVVTDQSGQYGGYGTYNSDGTSKPGGVLFIKHSKTISQYGHIRIDPKIKPGDTVEEGQIIGSIAPFWGDGLFLPHLHFGIWKSLTPPPKPWGYVAGARNSGHWIDPLTWKYKNWH